MRLSTRSSSRSERPSRDNQVRHRTSPRALSMTASCFPLPSPGPPRGWPRSVSSSRRPVRDRKPSARMACRWASQALRYGYGVTNVQTTAGAALLGGIGVCQDYAHIMIAICRAAGVPTRYVSGHLTGEGGSHAWVEVLHATRRGASTTATGFDPTHDRRTDERYSDRRGRT